MNAPASRDQILLQIVEDQSAVAFVNTVYSMFEAWENIRTKKDVDVDRLMLAALIEFPTNPFFQRFGSQILPVVVTAMNAWQDVRDDPEAKVAEFLTELVPMVVFSCKGYETMRQTSSTLRQLYGS